MLESSDQNRIEELQSGGRMTVGMGEFCFITEEHLGGCLGWGGLPKP